VQAWLGIFGVFGGPVLGLFSLGLYVPWASARAALTSAITSLIFILWVALGGNISRVEGAYSAPKLSLEIDGCPAAWNVSKPIAEVEIYESWWPHFAIYEISYMWYSGISCCCVIIMGSILSLVPGFRQDEEAKPEPELLVSVSESLFCCWPTSISSVLVRFWEKQQNQDLKDDNQQHQEQQHLHSNNWDLALKERNKEVTDGTEIWVGPPGRN